MSPITRIRKRNGQIVNFDQNKITEAIWKAAQNVGGKDKSTAEKISNQVSTVLEVFFKNDDIIPSVEQIQDLVEKILIENGHAKTAKAFIIYREEHFKLRQEKAKILGSSDSIILTFPKNASLEDVKNLLKMAEETGCTIINQNISSKSQEISFPTPFNERKNQDLDMNNQRPETVLEEIIAPPIEIIA